MTTQNNKFKLKEFKEYLFDEFIGDLENVAEFDIIGYPGSLYLFSGDTQDRIKAEIRELKERLTDIDYDEEGQINYKNAKKLIKIKKEFKKNIKIIINNN
jgi:hypothetical protein